jgi:shikimate dehydrogenase
MDRYGVIGNPVAHSKSPEIHAAFASATGQVLTYERILAQINGFADTVRELKDAGCKGVNVTVPFKLEAAALARRLTERARAAGAVNTLTFSRVGTMGDNTDGAGLVADIVRNAGVDLHGRRILLLGAGGAARGVILPLLGEGPDQLVIANRTVATAEGLAERFAPNCRPGQRLLACAFDAVDSPYDVVINATSASLLADMPAVPASAFGDGTLALDMMYGKQPSLFMQFAERHGATARDGLGMLVEQAAEAFFVWRGVRPATAAVLQHLRSTL